MTSEGSERGHPTLPAWKAFTVQLSLASGERTGVFAGRVEHLDSGRRARFASADDLIAILRRMLTEVDETAS